MYDKEIGKIGINNGYQYFCDSKHPLSDVNTRVYLHRHLASLKINRWLLSSEHVHHIDGNKLNNDFSNLEVLSNSEHAKLHKPSKLTEVACKLCGVIFIQDNSRTEYCSRKCSIDSHIKDKKITKEILDELIPSTTWKKLGEMFGYSDAGIRKRAISLGCSIPIRNKRNSLLAQ